jgi:hypothetical protein
VGDRDKLLTYLNSALKVPSGLDIFARGTTKKLNFVDQCYRRHSTPYTSSPGASSAIYDRRPATTTTALLWKCHLLLLMD